MDHVISLLDNEIWKDILNYPNYQISNKGKVYSKIYKKILSPANVGGYFRVGIYNDEGQKTIPIHRLVALNFIPKSENLDIVDHIDGNSTNNCVENLTWVTHSENVKNITKTPKEIKELVSARAIWKIDKTTNQQIKKYDSVTLAAEELFNEGKIKTKLTGKILITKVLTGAVQIINKNGKQREKCALTGYGFKWKYHVENDIDDEIWKDIPPEYIKGVEGYKVSNYGKIKNHRGRIGKGTEKHHSGYNIVTIKKGTFLMHRLVAQVFIPNPENKPEVNHKDKNRLNNHVDNLEWYTKKENCKHRWNV
jgi:hypothetical protein